MAWIYLAESEESQKPWKDTSDRSPTVKTTDTLKRFSCLECHQANSQLRPFGMTCKHSEVRNFHCDQIFSTADSHAKTFPLPDAERAWQESAADYFSRSSGSVARYDPLSCSLKTYQSLLHEEGLESFQNLPPYGLIADGVCYQLRMWERCTSENDGGAWPTSVQRMKETHHVPTPTASDHIERESTSTEKLNFETNKTVSLDRWVNKFPQPQIWRTPQAWNASQGPKSPKKFMRCMETNESMITLTDQVRMWPTPTTRDWKDGTAESCRNVPVNSLLGRAVHWPTPSSNNRTGGATGLAGGSGNRLKLYKMLGKEEGKKMGCQSLNPYWVEWLMGYRLGWTVLEPWATQWFRPKREKRLKDSSASNKNGGMK